MSLKRVIWSGSAVAITALMAVVLLFSSAQVAYAAAPNAVNVIIEEPDDSIPQPTTTATTLRIVADIDDAGGGQTDETIVTFQTTIGTFASSGTNSASVQCAIDDQNFAAAAVDAADENVTLAISQGAGSVFNAEAEDQGVAAVDDEASLNGDEEGCLAVEVFLIVPVNAAVGTYAITAQTTNGISGLENLTIAAGTGTTPAGITAVSQSHDAIGFTTSGTFEPLVNGTLWTVRVTDANSAGVNGTQVQFTTDSGVLIDASNGTQDGGTDDTNTEAEILAACASTGSLGQSIIGVTETQGTSSTAAGRVRVVLCGRSGDAGTTANLTARTLGSSQFSVSDAVTVGGKPSSSDIVLSQSGGIVTATVMVGGVPAADDLDVRWTVIPTDTAVVTPTCSSLHDGTATTTAATTGAAPATVVATVTDNDVECDATPIRTDGSAQLALGAGGTTPPAGTAFTGTVPARGSIGLLVIRGTQTAPGLVVAFGTAGCPVESLAVLRVGRWLIYINGAPVVVNAAFPASLEDLTPFFVRCAA